MPPTAKNDVGMVFVFPTPSCASIVARVARRTHYSGSKVTHLSVGMHEAIDADHDSDDDLTMPHVLTMATGHRR